MRKQGLTASAMGMLAWCLLCTQSFAQEGFPLDGTWRGEWGPPGDGRHVVLVMDWDGERINGIINPGRSSVEFDSAELEPSTWTVRIAAQSPEAEAIVIEGTLEDIGSYNRYIVGTWTQAGRDYPFRITRE